MEGGGVRWWGGWRCAALCGGAWVVVRARACARACWRRGGGGRGGVEEAAEAAAAAVARRKSGQGAAAWERNEEGSGPPACGEEGVVPVWHGHVSSSECVVVLACGVPVMEASPPV